MFAGLREGVTGMYLIWNGVEIFKLAAWRKSRPTAFKHFSGVDRQNTSELTG